MGASLSKQLLHAHEQTKLHAEMMSWIGCICECRLCTTLTWSDLNPPCIILYSRRAACRWWSVRSWFVRSWSVRSCCDKKEVRCCASLNLSCLCYGCQCYTLAVAQQCHGSTRGCSIFGKYLNVRLKLTIYGRKHGRIHTWQCSPASVGLAQACPNNIYTVDVLMKEYIYMHTTNKHKT